jgi:hypothetical protein
MVHYLPGNRQSFCNHASSQNDKVRIDCPITLASPNQLFQIAMVIFLALVILSVF